MLKERDAAAVAQGVPVAVDKTAKAFESEERTVNLVVFSLYNTLIAMMNIFFQMNRSYMLFCRSNLVILILVVKE